MKCSYPEDLTVADDEIVEYLRHYCIDQLKNLLEAASIDQFHDFNLEYIIICIKIHFSC